MKEHRSPISGVATWQEKWVATAGYDNQVILWDATTKEVIARGVHDHLANQVRFSPCGSYLVSASSDHTARIWKVPTMKLQAVLSEHMDDVESVAFHPNKPLIATACRDHMARVFDLNGQLLRNMRGHNQDVISVEWSESGNELLTSSDDGTVKRWNGTTGSLLEDLDLGGVETDTIAITARGDVYAGNDAGEIVWIRNGMVTKTKAHNAGIKRLVYSAHSKSLVSLSYDRQVCVFRVDSTGALRLLRSTTMAAVVWPRSCAFLGPDRLVFATFGSSYAVLHLETMQWSTESIVPTPGLNAILPVGFERFTIGDAGILWLNEKPHHKLGSLCNFLCPLGDLVITGGQMGAIFACHSGTVIYQHHSPLNCAAAFKKNGIDYAIVGTYTGEGIVLVQEPGKAPRVDCIVNLHQNAVKGLSVSGDIVFSVCATGAAAFHRVGGFALLHRADRAHAKIANGCAALPSESFASVSRDLTLRIWKDLECEIIPTPHSHSIKCVAASPCGRFVATGSYNGLVAIMDLVTRIWISVVRVSMSGISSLAFDKAMGGFIAASYDGNIYNLKAKDLQEIA